jgi:hypothetical protein
METLYLKQCAPHFYPDIRTLRLTWRGAGNVLLRCSGAPVFDPTDEGELEIEPCGDYASSTLLASTLASTPVVYLFYELILLLFF